MLKNIPKLLSPELLKILCEMGHGDEVVIADANFPSANYAKKLIRADGISGTQMLSAIMELFPLDTYAASNAILMEIVQGDISKTPIWDEYMNIVAEHDANGKFSKIERFAFYERAKEAYAVIATGEEALYANLILKKGVIK